MEAQKSFGIGCLGITLVVMIGIVAIGFLCWDLPTGETTAQGNQLQVRDYVLGALDAFTRKESGKASESTAASEATSGKGEIINAEVFGLLRPGVTTYGLIERYMGPGELVSESGFGDLTSQAYRWHNPDGSMIFLVFQNGKLVSKSQNGLQ